MLAWRTQLNRNAVLRRHALYIQRSKTLSWRLKTVLIIAI